ncbi:MAG: hypothetical protein IKO74_05185 [Selenomonadaceae bacterium]|nr:hypothetical protein [Selenomonadaceae bacterium]
MSMVINTNIQATRTHNVYNKNNDYMNQALTRVATGMKINSAKDGAANWAISEKMRERIRANDQANQNVQNDTALLKTAQGGIGNTIDILKTLKERAINAANDSNINTDRSAIGTEVYQLLEQIDDNAAKVKFNGRTLLNGDTDKTVGQIYGLSSTTETDTTDATDATEDTSNVTEPTAATMNSATASSAVYHVALFKDSSTAGTGEAAVGATKLTELFDKSGAGATSLGIKAGDKITISWKEDDVEQSKEIEVTADSTIADLAFTKGALKVTFDASAPSPLKDQNNGTVTDSSDANVNGTANSLNAVGDKGVAITDFKVSVTYADEDNDNALTTRTAAQTALAFTNDKSLAVTPEGSNAVFLIKGLYSSTSAATTASKLSTLGLASGTAGFNSAADTDTYKIKVGDTELEFTGASKIQDVTDAFAKKGIAVTLVTATGTLKDAEGNNVTNADGENVQAAAPSTGTANLYFVGKNGEAVDKVTIAAYNGTTARSVVSEKLATPDQVQAVASSDTDTDTDTTDTATAASTDLTFHVGGEAGFNLDISISKMTTESLFGVKSEEFAKMFLSKDALTKGDGTNGVVAMIDNAIQNALNEQTKLGAIESRLGYTSDNITTMNENLEAADSAYRDSDIAKEMTKYMKYSVLAQASQYMLAQTSQNAFSVLNLLQA